MDAEVRTSPDATTTRITRMIMVAICFIFVWHRSDGMIKNLDLTMHSPVVRTSPDHATKHKQHSECGLSVSLKGDTMVRCIGIVKN